MVVTWVVVAAVNPLNSQGYRRKEEGRDFDDTSSRLRQWQ